MGTNSKRNFWPVNIIDFGNSPHGQSFWRGNKVARKFLDSAGQSSAEYAVVASISVGIIVALGMLSNSLEDGLFVQHAIESASHNIGDAFGGIVDVFCY